MYNTKRLRNGNKITFTKSNPITTFNAVIKFARNNGFNINNIHKARTDSVYADFETNFGLSVSVRCANHTKSYCFNTEELGYGVEFDGDTLSVDLALVDANINDIINLIKECDILHARNVTKYNRQNASVLCSFLGIEEEGEEQKDYIKTYNTALKKAVKLFPMPQLTVADKWFPNIVYHFGENITVDVDGDPYYEYVKQNELNPKKVEQTRKETEQQKIRDYRFNVPNGNQIFNEREAIKQRRIAFVKKALNECKIISVVQSVINEWFHN